MKYTREYLQPALTPFITQLKKLSEKLNNITFTPENLLQIKDLCTSKISNLIAPIQKSINESIYLSQLRNQFPNTSYLKFCLGITSAENLVNYYEKTEIILPYVASEIKQQICRLIDIRGTYAFFYYEIHALNSGDYTL